MSLIDDIDTDFDLKKPSKPSEPSKPIESIEPSLDEQMAGQGSDTGAEEVAPDVAPADTPTAEIESQGQETEKLEGKEDEADYQIRRQISQDIFARTGKKVVVQDPMIEVIMIWRELNKESLEHVSNALEASTNEIIDNLIFNQDKVLVNFDEKLTELKDTLARLENQKEAIVADVWGKMQARVTKQIEEQLSRDLKAIAKNANNQVNNQRNILMGGIGGLLVGLILCAIIVFILK